MVTEEIYVKYRDEHRKLWLWLSDTLASKADWPGWGEHYERDSDSQQTKELKRELFQQLCFPCAVNDGSAHCETCPVLWDDDKTCKQSGSMYQRYADYAVGLIHDGDGYRLLATRIATQVWKDYKDWVKDLMEFRETEHADTTR